MFELVISTPISLNDCKVKVAWSKSASAVKVSVRPTLYIGSLLSILVKSI